LDNYRKAWGWALSQSSTWLEVFDVRWEAVHSWGGCPTWQLSKFCLGLSPSFDVGQRHFVLDLRAGHTLKGAKGSIPARSGTSVAVSWTRLSSSSVQYTVTISSPIFVWGWPHAVPGRFAKLSPAWQRLGVGSHSAAVPCA